MKQQVTDEGDPRLYWTQIPNILCEIGLTPLELALYVHLKRAAGASPVGKCFKSTATLARETGMGAGTVSRTKTALETRRSTLGNRPLIRTKEVPNPKGGKAFQEITITDIWKLNTDRFTSSTVEVDTPEIESSDAPKPPSSVEIEAQNQVPVEVEPSSKPISPVEIKKNVEEELREEVGEAKPSQPSGVQILREVAGLYPPTESRDRYLQILGSNPNLVLLRQCRAEWLDRGYNKMSWKWFTDWYAQGGIPERNGQPKPKITTSGEKIVADHGDWYEVEACQGGGTSPRYRTAEAFARETGRDLETVRAGWN